MIRNRPKRRRFALQVSTQVERDCAKGVRRMVRILTRPVSGFVTGDKLCSGIFASTLTQGSFPDLPHRTPGRRGKTSAPQLRKCNEDLGIQQARQRRPKMSPKMGLLLVAMMQYEVAQVVTRAITLALGPSIARHSGFAGRLGRIAVRFCGCVGNQVLEVMPNSR